jgi:hypothetical protein
VYVHGGEEEIHDVESELPQEYAPLFSGVKPLRSGRLS